MEQKRQMELEAKVFRRLLKHLRENTELQNIDMMNLTGFCRNCLANWYQEEMDKMGEEISKEKAREFIYSMPFETWKQKYQKDAEKEQVDKFREKHNNS